MSKRAETSERKRRRNQRSITIVNTFDKVNMNSSMNHEEILCYYSSNQVSNDIENQPLTIAVRDEQQHPEMILEKTR